MSVEDSGFWGYYWAGYSHQELYDMVRSGKGAAVVAHADEAWTSFAKLMNESQERIEKLQRDAGVSWEGQAATSMRDGVSPLSGWAQESAAAGEQTNASI